MEQVQEVPQEPDAIENGNLGAIRFLVERRGVLGHKWVDHIRGDKQVVRPRRSERSLLEVLTPLF